MKLIFKRLVVLLISPIILLSFIWHLLVDGYVTGRELYRAFSNWMDD